MLRYQQNTLASIWRITPSDRALCILPLHHVHGLVNLLLTPLSAGAHVELHETYTPSLVWDAILRPHHAPTLFMAVPAVYRKLILFHDAAPAPQRTLMRAAAARVRLFVSGSAALPRADFLRWEEISGRPVLERYGMTETGMTLSNAYDHRVQGTLGVPLPGVETRLAGEDAGVGTLHVRGPGVFQRYWNRETETEAAFRDGWFDTGDVVRRVGDGFRMVGRASADIFKTGGYKVSAVEVEEGIRECPGVVDVAVVGVPDRALGEVGVAVVVMEEGGVGAVKEWARGRLTKYQVPKRFLSVDELPRNLLGKVQKNVLKERVLEGVLG